MLFHAHRINKNIKYLACHRIVFSFANSMQWKKRYVYFFTSLIEEARRKFGLI